MLKRAFFATLLMSSLGLAPAGAAPLVPTALKAQVESGKMKILRDFKAAGGLIGLVMFDKDSNETTIIYSTADGQYVLAGMLLDPEGRNLTKQYADEYLPKRDYAPAFKTFSAGGEAAAITVGSSAAKAEIIVLFDANADYSLLMHRLLKPAIEAGELRVRYVPVATIEDADVKGAGILASRDGKALLDKIAGGGNADQSKDKTLLDRVRNNTKLMQKYGFNGTPAVLYKAKTGDNETVTASHGVPSLLQMFKALAISGQVDKIKADPALAKYLR